MARERNYSWFADKPPSSCCEWHDRVRVWLCFETLCIKLYTEECETYRIIEYSKLEGTHKDHQVQLLALHSTNQKSDHMSASVFHMLPELSTLVPWALPWGACSSAQPLWWRTFSWYPTWASCFTAPCCSLRFYLCHQKEISAASPLLLLRNA